MTQYKQLTLAKRYAIGVLHKQGKSQKAIALFLSVDKSTISRELKRNSASGKYEAGEAHRRYCYKKRRRDAYKLSASIELAIEAGLKNDLSPEQKRQKRLSNNVPR
jgi:transposase, IS30 family